MASVACAHQPTLAALQCMKIQAVATGKTSMKNVFFPVCMYVYIAGCPLHAHIDEIEAQTETIHFFVLYLFTHTHLV